MNPDENHLYECEDCSSKPGSPDLCSDCLARRNVTGLDWKGPRPSSVGFVSKTRQRTRRARLIRQVHVTIPFVLPIACLVFTALSYRGVPYCLFGIAALAAIWLSIVSLRTFNEMRANALGSVTMAMDLQKVTLRYIEKGVAPEQAAEMALGYSIGVLMGVTRWSPYRIAMKAKEVAEATSAYLKHEGVDHGP